MANHFVCHHAGNMVKDKNAGMLLHVPDEFTADTTNEYLPGGRAKTALPCWWCKLTAYLFH